MKKIGLSVIVPLYNAKDWIVATLENLNDASRGSGFNVEVIVVDDGSTDGGSKDLEKLKLDAVSALRIIRQDNKGRYLARKAGLLASKYQNILFIDSRVFIGKDSLKYLHEKIKDDPDQIWNAHVNIDKKGNIFTRFWDAIVMVAWRRYFKHPKETAYGIKDFDFYPKGTTLLYLPKKRLYAAMKSFESETNDIQNSSDDTLLLRFMNKRQDIHISPEFNCVYHGRTNFTSFMRHAYHRGEFFIDGFLRPSTRFFLPLLVVLLTSALLPIALVFFTQTVAIMLLIGVLLFPTLFFVGSWFLGAEFKDALSLGVLSVPFAASYLLGLWRGVLRKNKISNSLAESVGAYRKVLRGSLGEYLVVFALYLFCMLLITKGALLHMSSQLFTGVGDGTAGFLWLNATDHTLNPFISHYSSTNFPYGESTTGLTLMSYIAYWFPMRILSALFNPFIALNVVMYAGYSLAAMSMYLVVKRVTGSRSVSFIAGFAAAFVPYALIKSAGHMSYIFGGIFTLIIGAFLAFWPRPTIKKAALLGLLMGVSLYFDGYFMLIAIVLSVALVLSGLAYSFFTRGWALAWSKILRLSLVAVGVFSLLAAPIIITGLVASRQISSSLASNRSPIANEMKAYSAAKLDFVVPQANSLLWGNNKKIQALIQEKNQRSNGSENTNYISPVLYVISIVGAVLLIHRLLWPRCSKLLLSKGEVQTVSLVGLVSLFAAILSLSIMFSPEIVVFGVRIPMPGQLLIDFNISYWRVPSRLFVLYNIAIVLWATVSTWLILCRLENARCGAVRKIVPVLVVCGLLTFVVLDYATIFKSRPLNMNKFPSALYWLRDKKDIDVVAFLPLTDPLDMRTGYYATAQIIHEKNVVNFKNPSSSRLNNALGSAGNGEVLNLLRLRGVDVVLFQSTNSSCENNKIGTTVAESDMTVYDMEKQISVPGKLCILELAKTDQEVDWAFVVYNTDDFSPSPNAPDQSDTAFRGGIGRISLTKDDLSSRIDGRVSLTGLVRIMPTVKGSGWEIWQNGHMLASGVFGDKYTSRFSVVADGSSDVEFHINTPNYQLKHAEVYLEEVTANVIPN